MGVCAEPRWWSWAGILFLLIYIYFFLLFFRHAVHLFFPFSINFNYFIIKCTRRLSYRKAQYFYTPPHWSTPAHLKQDLQQKPFMKSSPHFPPPSLLRARVSARGWRGVGARRCRLRWVRGRRRRRRRASIGRCWRTAAHLDSNTLLAANCRHPWGEVCDTVAAVQRPAPRAIKVGGVGVLVELRIRQASIQRCCWKLPNNKGFVQLVKRFVPAGERAQGIEPTVARVGMNLVKVQRGATGPCSATGCFC